MIVTFVTQADQNGIDSQWHLFFTDLDELLSKYEQQCVRNNVFSFASTLKKENARGLEINHCH